MKFRRELGASLKFLLPLFGPEDFVAEGRLSKTYH